MRIVIVSLHTNPYARLGSGDAGGLNVVVQGQASALAAMGHEVEILTRRSDRTSPDVEQVAPGITLRRLVAGPAETLPKSEIDAYDEFFTDAMRHVPPGDVVHAHHWMAGDAALPVAREWGVPILLSYHSIAAKPGELLSSGEPPESPRRGPAEAMLARECDRIVTISHAEARTVVDRLGGNPFRIRVLAPGVDHDLFRPLVPGEHAYLDAPYLFFAARLQPLKGPDLAIEAMQHVPEQVHLVITGDISPDFADYRDELTAMVERLGLTERVHFIPPQPREEFARMMRGALAVVVPSYSETYGLVALESAASGVPVIATASGGLLESVADMRSGILLSTRDPKVWGDTVARLVDHPTDHARLALGAVRHAGTLTWADCAKALVDIYEDAIAHPSC